MTDFSISPAYDRALATGSYDDWRARALAALKGAGFDRLVSASSDNIEIAPLYARAAGDLPRALRQQPGPWAIAQRVDHPEPHEANALALADLNGGANALTLVTSASPAARGFGVGIKSLADIAAALANVHLDLIGLRLDAGLDALAIAPMLADYVEHRELDPAKVRIDFGIDLFSSLALSGGLPAPLDELAEQAASLAKDLASRGFVSSVMLADGRVFHEAGASEAQELALVLASAVETLRALEGSGFTLAQARASLACLLSADADQFLTLAKFRAARRLFARAENACGLPPQPLRLHAETSWRMMTKYDPHMNILRCGLAVFSAGLGGADAICAMPFTAALGLPGAFARRVARNSQLVLTAESHLAAVADPAAGSGGFEALTQELCEAAWRIFQTIEAEGGLARALQSGFVQREIKQKCEERQRKIATGKLPLTGTSEFPDLGELPAETLPVASALPRHGGKISVTCAALAPIRDGEQFEHLRASSAGAGPVFVITFGTLSDYAGRVGFVRNLFAAGGLDLDVREHLQAAADIIAAAKAARAQLICLCSSDALYAEHAVAAAQNLRAAGFAHVWLAARPREQAGALEQAGITRFVYAGCNRIDVLAAAQAILLPAAADARKQKTGA